MSNYTAEADRLIIEAQAIGDDRQAGCRRHGATASHVYRTDVDDLWDDDRDQRRLARRRHGQLIADRRDVRHRGQCERHHPHLRRPDGSRPVGSSPGNTSELRVTLTPEGDGTRLTLQHSGEVPYEFYDQFGPGATGVGWDQALLGLAAYLAFDTDVPLETTEWATLRRRPRLHPRIRGCVG